MAPEVVVRRARDAMMLRALLADERTSARPEEEDAFRDMLGRLGQYGLSRPQRDWVEGRFRELELDAGEGALNLHSAGLVPQGVPERRAPGGGRLPLEFERMPLPKRPPGR